MVLATATVQLAGARDLRAQDATPHTIPSRTLDSGRPGPTVTFVAGIHGGKVAAVRALEQLMDELRLDRLRRGRVMLVAPANLRGFRAGLAQASPDDGLNLNRVFPGNAAGRPTERLAERIMREIVSHSDYLVDLHGSDGDEAVARFAYAARPGVDPAVDSAALDLAARWGTPLVVWDEAGPRTLAESRFLQTAAHLNGVPAITVFEGGSAREDPEATSRFKAGVRSLLNSLGLLGDSLPPPAPPERLARREILLPPRAGQWEPIHAPGTAVAGGELLGTLRSSWWRRTPVRAATAGRILHQRLRGPVPVGVPLVILGVRDDASPTTDR
jgi:predicted deacylase